MKKRMFSEKSISEGLRLAGLDYEAMSKKGQGAMREIVEKMAKMLNDPFLIEAGAVTMKEDDKKKYATEESRNTAEYVALVLKSFEKL